MDPRTRHPRLSVAACRVYRVMIRLYPSAFRREFGHELIVTFRNHAEDVLDNGGLLSWIAFLGHIVADWARTWGTLSIEREPHLTASLLGLGADEANGCLDRSTVDISFVFAAAGVVLEVVGWYTYATILPHCMG